MTRTPNRPRPATRSGAVGRASAPVAGVAGAIDCHAHLARRYDPSWKQRDRQLIDAGDTLGIEKFCCSILPERMPSNPQVFRECNNWVAEAMRRFRGRVLGYCYVNPGCQPEALDEIRDCVERRGFIGIKLYNEYVCTEPVLYPLVELAIELGVPILEHAGHGHAGTFLKSQPRISDGGHLAELSQRYPEAMLICGHLCGGGDWEWTIKALRNAPGVYLDTSGSVIDEGAIEMAAKVLGADRLLFGCDMSMTAGVGKLRSARLGARDKQKILSGNMKKILGKRGA